VSKIIIDNDNNTRPPLGCRFERIDIVIVCRDVLYIYIMYIYTRRTYNYSHYHSSPRVEGGSRVVSIADIYLVMLDIDK